MITLKINMAITLRLLLFTETDSLMYDWKLTNLATIKFCLVFVIIWLSQDTSIIQTS